MWWKRFSLCKIGLDLTEVSSNKTALFLWSTVCSILKAENATEITVKYLHEAYGAVIIYTTATFPLRIIIIIIITTGLVLDRVHNSRRLLDRLFAFFDRVTLTLTFWPNINWWGRYRDGLSLCPSLMILVTALLVLSCRQIDRNTHSTQRITESQTR